MSAFFAGIAKGLKVGWGIVKGVWSILPASTWIIIGLGLTLLAAGSAIHQRGQTITALKAQLETCGKDKAAAETERDALTKQIKNQAAQGGQSYADAEARARAECAGAYDAGSKRLRDDQAVAAGRYVPPGSPGKPGR